MKETPSSKRVRLEARARIERLALEGLRSGRAWPEDPEFLAKLRARIHAKATAMRRPKPAPKRGA